MFKDLPIGIDLGTTNSCIGVFRNGNVEILANQSSGRTTPSVVSFCGKEISVGDQTLNYAFSDPEKVIYSVKRIIGKKFTEPGFNNLINNLAYKNKIKRSDNDRPLICVDFNGDKREYLPEEISAMVLRRLKENAENTLQRSIKKVVITIPAYFTEAQREATKIAAEGAGLEVIKIINEPTAAAIAYGLKDSNDLLYSEEDSFFTFKDENKKENNQKEKTILVFDLGGGTFDVTCLTISIEDGEPQFEILGHSGNVLLGGDDLDNILVDHCIKVFKKGSDISINTRNTKDIKARKRLKNVCEKAKKILSYETQTTINIDNLYDDKDFTLTITRALFEELCKSKFKELIPPVEQALNVSKLEKKDIEEVLFVGGSSRIPKIEEIVREYFGKDIKICKSINPDEIVAYGATLQAAISLKADKVNDVLINDICSHSIGIKVYKRNEFDKDFSEMIENGTNIPFEVEKEYTTAFDDQKEVSIQIFEGEDESCINNRLLGKFQLSGISKAKAGEPKITVKIEIDGDSIIHVTASEEKSGVTNSLNIKYDKGVMNNEQIKKMKDRLGKNNEFEKTKINQKEKELSEKMTLLTQDYQKNRDLSTLKEIEKIQEQLVEISLDKNNKYNTDKQFNAVKRLFQLYDYIFTKYCDQYKNLTNEYLKKIEKYMSFFKITENNNNYLSTLLKIFEKDKYEKRLSHIIYICINLYIDSLKDEKNKKFSSYYYNECLDIIRKFRNQINNSDLKEKFNEIEKICLIEKEKIVIENQTKSKNSNNNFKVLTPDQALYAIDNYSYIVENTWKPSSKKEKAVRAFVITKLVHLELNYFQILDYEKLERMVNEAANLVNECQLSIETDSWIETLLESQSIIKQKLSDKKYDISSRLNSFSKEINGDNDNENIEFFEFINSNLIDDGKKDKKSEDIKDLYNTEPQKLLAKAKKIISKFPDNEGEVKKKKNWFLTKINKIGAYIGKAKNFFRKNRKK